MPRLATECCNVGRSAAVTLALALTRADGAQVSTGGSMVAANLEIAPGECMSRSIADLETPIRIELSVPDSDHEFQVTLKADGQVKWTVSRTDFHQAQRNLLSPVLTAREVEVCTSDEAPVVSWTHSITVDPGGEQLSTFGPGEPSFFAADLFESADKPHEYDRVRLRNVLSNLLWLGIENASTHVMVGCTSFFISESLALTNQHCLDGEVRVRGWSGSAGVNQAAAPTFQHLDQVCAGDSSHGPDAAVLRVPGATAAARVPLARSIDLDREMVLIGYPGPRQPLSLSYDSLCRLRGEGSDPGYFSALTNRRVSPRSYLLHGCDSAPGNSGSPILSRDLIAVVGIHYWGHPGYRNDEPNRAESISHILDHIRTHCPTIYNEIAASEGE